MASKGLFFGFPYLQLWMDWHRLETRLYFVWWVRVSAGW